MKTLKHIVLWIWIAVYTVLSMVSCATTTVTTITTDKAGTVTDTTVVRKGTDPAALKMVEVAAEIYRPRPAVIVREEKSGDIRTILRGRPITRQEIANRWKPLP